MTQLAEAGAVTRHDDDGFILATKSRELLPDRIGSGSRREDHRDGLLAKAES